MEAIVSVEDGNLSVDMPSIFCGRVDSWLVMGGMHFPLYMENHHHVSAICRGTSLGVRNHG